MGQPLEIGLLVNGSDLRAHDILRMKPDESKPVRIRALLTCPICGKTEFVEIELPRSEEEDIGEVGCPNCDAVIQIIIRWNQ